MSDTKLLDSGPPSGSRPALRSRCSPEVSLASKDEERFNEMWKVDSKEQEQKSESAGAPRAISTASVAPRDGGVSCKGRAFVLLHLPPPASNDFDAFLDEMLPQKSRSRLLDILDSSFSPNTQPVKPEPSTGLSPISSQNNASPMAASSSSALLRQAIIQRTQGGLAYAAPDFNMRAESDSKINLRRSICRH